jgi:hypothetical protein
MQVNDKIMETIMTEPKIIRKGKDVDWHIIYEGSGSITGNSWIEEVAYLGDEQWLLKLYDDPAWSFEPEEPMQPEEKNSEELVDWVKSIDSASNKDSFARPRQKSLYDVAKNLGATRCVKLLSSIRMSIPKENTDMKKTGTVIRKGKRLSITEALPDSPIYNRGFVIGGMRMKDSSKNTTTCLPE